jgi:glutathione synthase/RimK-type ligase-like ATP-grasp enzyme
MSNGACILNSGSAAWAFEPLAHELSTTLDIPISQKPHRHNYVLAYENLSEIPSSFIPLRALEIAADKRKIAEAFGAHAVPAPKTYLLDSPAAVLTHARENGGEWCLKFPTSCGGAGHMLLTKESTIPEVWPRPYVLQEFIRMPEPRVYRTYIAGPSIFGWVTRKFPPGAKSSPWVAHARGAIYELETSPPPEAANAAARAFDAVGLTGSFGCADLLQTEDGRWLVLEVGSDGLFNHVDRDLGSADFLSDLHRQIATAFRAYTAA